MEEQEEEGSKRIRSNKPGSFTARHCCLYGWKHRYFSRWIFYFIGLMNFRSDPSQTPASST